MMTALKNPQFVLASNSPRRRELLALGGWMFRVWAAEIDESVLPGEPPPDYVLRLARTKAQAVARQLSGDEVVLAADTTVADGGRILGKPDGPAQAAAMLRQLRGHTHQVFTALAVLHVAAGTLESELCTTDVPMRNYTDQEITAYVASGDPLDKAGAYAIQNRQFQPVAALSGCYASVMGLPLCHLTRALRRMGLACPVDVPAACQAALVYRCDVFSHILGPASDRSA
jgi:MAF protein